MSQCNSSKFQDGKARIKASTKGFLYPWMDGLLRKLGCSKSDHAYSTNYNGCLRSDHECLIEANLMSRLYHRNLMMVKLVFGFHNVSPWSDQGKSWSGGKMLKLQYKSLYIIKFVVGLHYRCLGSDYDVSQSGKTNDKVSL